MKKNEYVDIDTSDDFLDAPDIKYADGKTLVERVEARDELRRLQTERPVAETESRPA